MTAVCNVSFVLTIFDVDIIMYSIHLIDNNILFNRAERKTMLRRNPFVVLLLIEIKFKGNLMSSLCSNNIPPLTNGLSRIYDQCYCCARKHFFKSNFTEETFLQRQICSIKFLTLLLASEGLIMYN